MRRTNTTPNRSRRLPQRAVTIIGTAALLLVASACASETTAPIHESDIVVAAGGRPSSDTTGPQIAFSASDDAEWHIFTIDPSGSGLRRITKGRTSSYHPAWSPDRQRIAFVRDAKTWGSGIYTMDPRGRTVRQVAPDSLGWLSDPSWSPDGRTLVFWASLAGVHRTEILTVPADGSSPPVRLTNDTLYDSHPMFSPDGSKIAFTRSSGTLKPNIHVMDADGQNLHQFTFCTTWCGYMSWSPDGLSIAFQGQDTLYVGKLGTGEHPAPIASGLASFARPRWSPNGSEIVYVGASGGMFDLFAVPAGGGQPRRITNSPIREVAPSWAQ